MVDRLQISYSSSNVLASCARKFQLNKMFQHPAREFESIAMEAGTVLHTAIQDYMVYGSVDRALWILMTQYPHRYCWDWNEDRSYEACMATLFEMIDHPMLSHYKLAEIKKPDGEIVPAIEVPFELIFDGVVLPDGRGLSFIGFIDAIMQSKISNRYATLDVKTHRSTTIDRTAKFKFDAQMVPYGITLEHMLGHTIDAFEVLYLDCYVDLLEPRVMDYVFTKTQKDIDEWLMNRIIKIRELISYMQMGVFPRTEGGCESFFKPCTYLDNCENRDPVFTQQWLLMDNEPAPPRIHEPWITGVITLPEGMIA